MTKPTAGTTVLGTFADGTPAITERVVGTKGGKVVVNAFLPGLSYFQPALPQRPTDRGATDAAYTHFVPSNFSSVVRDSIGAIALDTPRPVNCSNPLVHARAKVGPKGTAIPLVNWSEQNVTVNVTVTMAHITATSKASLAGGDPVKLIERVPCCTYTLDLPAGGADALVLRG
jgi:hypothetical protein